METEQVAYQNKDITSKFLAEHMKGKSFQVYGLNLPEIVDVKPTNLPTIQAYELRMDNLFELEDGSIAIIDYESTYDKADKVKYLGYLTGVARRYQDEGKPCPILRMIVIYTGDIQRKSVSCHYDIGALQMNIEAAFLSELDSEGIFPQLKEKVEKNELLNDEELMKFIILPLSYRKPEEKTQKLKETVELAVRIQDRKQQVFTLAGLLVFSDKIMDLETAERIRKVMEMTQVARIFEEEKQAALRKAKQEFEEEKRKMEEEKRQTKKKFEKEKRETKKKFEEEKRQTEKKFEEEKRQTEKKFEEEKRQTEKKLEEEKRQSMKQIVKKMLKRGDTPEEIVMIVSDYSLNDVEAVKAEMEK